MLEQNESSNCAANTHAPHRIRMRGPSLEIRRNWVPISFKRSKFRVLTKNNRPNRRMPALFLFPLGIRSRRFGLVGIEMIRAKTARVVILTLQILDGRNGRFASLDRSPALDAGIAVGHNQSFRAKFGRIYLVYKAPRILSSSLSKNFMILFIIIRFNYTPTMIR